MTIKMCRGLSTDFMLALKCGILTPLVDIIRADATLSLNIRDGYVNIYYRGGSLLKINERIGGQYTVEFDMKYFNGQAGLHGLPRPDLSALAIPNAPLAWIMNIPALKCVMDLWFGEPYHK